MHFSYRALYLIAGLLLSVLLLAACTQNGPQGEPPVMNGNTVPPIDREVPEQFETATFALG
jgi:hypothetical protein